MNINMKHEIQKFQEYKYSLYNANYIKFKNINKEQIQKN